MDCGTGAPTSGAAGAPAILRHRAGPEVGAPFPQFMHPDVCHATHGECSLAVREPFMPMF